MARKNKALASGDWGSSLIRGVAKVRRMIQKHPAEAKTGLQLKEITIEFCSRLRSGDLQIKRRYFRLIRTIVLEIA